ncbi:FecR family protein [Reichenbachiella ulvae]|uniref:DUF4974 domain-containing protein n=1 Tax=Reichenbachiella ulvae TaxID=2980104 RepID=A0ABT3CNM4_9BACT|nr:FecR family protein [Reichenbachiella ulvae]MCV9385074.1 DUF4974 domain-containing protein [Reichenbachiella ulvae]
MEEQFEIAELIAQKIKGSIDVTGLSRLQDWCDREEANRTLLERVESTDRQMDRLEIYAMFDKQRNWDQLEDRLSATKTVQWPVAQYFRYAAAVLLPLAIVYLFYFLAFRPEYKDLSEVEQIITQPPKSVTLQLANGEKLALNQPTQSVIVQGRAEITNDAESLVYKTQADPADATQELIYNELTVPRGQHYQLELADGTHVWLNSESSLRYPVAFDAKQREVYLTGEGYFEVTHTGSPFRVHAGDIDVRVLGTSFNVSVYDEESMATTLVEGKVQVEVKEEGSLVESQILAPGDQSVWNRQELQVSQVDTEPFTLWKEGKLVFSNDNLHDVMMRLARWYDFQFQFENEAAMHYHFTAQFDNQEGLLEILTLLEKTAEVQFKLKEKTIIIQ